MSLQCDSLCECCTNPLNNLTCHIKVCCFCSSSVSVGAFTTPEGAKDSLQARSLLKPHLAPFFLPAGGLNWLASTLLGQADLPGHPIPLTDQYSYWSWPPSAGSRANISIDLTRLGKTKGCQIGLDTTCQQNMTATSMGISNQDWIWWALTVELIQLWDRTDHSLIK